MVHEMEKTIDFSQKSTSFLSERLEKDVRGYLTTLLILGIIKKQKRTWGYQIKQELKLITESSAYINDSSLYTILRNLESEKYGQLVKSEMVKRRRYYVLSKKGETDLDSAVIQWLNLMEKSKTLFSDLELYTSWLEAI